MPSSWTETRTKTRTWIETWTWTRPRTTPGPRPGPGSGSKMAAVSDVALLLETVNFATEKHRNQRRKDPAATPYINHPIGVAWILSHEGGVTDLSVLQAALLHDTVEDTDTSLEELEEVFGAQVSGIVAEVTDDKTLPKAVRKRHQVEHARHCSAQAKLVKLADKLYNLRDLQSCTPTGWSEDRVQEYFVWAQEVVQGLRGTSPILEQELDQLFIKRGLSLEPDPGAKS